MTVKGNWGVELTDIGAVYEGPLSKMIAYTDGIKYTDLYKRW